MQFETLRWTAPGAEQAALTTQPAACLSVQPRDARRVDAGLALFNSPTLLGGQAAKAGLSCASCHANGRDNPHFQMMGVSGAPGTADVTHSFFSAARSNAKFDPVAIPDLADVGKVSRDPATSALEPFVRTLIVDEFAGQEPSTAMLGALAAYVRAIGRCGDSKAEPRTLDSQLLILRAALSGAADMAQHGDVLAARQLIAAARHQLGLISERFAGPRFGKLRAHLLDASRDLAGLTAKADMADEFSAAIQAWGTAFDRRTVTGLRQNEPKSLYNPRNLSFVALQRDNR